MKYFAKWLQTIALVALGGLGGLATAGAQTVYENYTFGTLAGLVGPGGWYDGPGQVARFTEPFGLAVDAGGNVYVADTLNHAIRKMTPAGVVSTVAGLAGTAGSNDGTGSAASFNSPYGVAVDAGGNVYVADTFNHIIRKITPTGVVITLAGLAGSPGAANGTGSAARFNYPYGVAVDASGNVYVADTFNSAIRKITPAGVVSTFAGLPGSSGNVNGTGTAARFKFPFGLGIDSAGNLFVADTYNQVIRKITPAGGVSAVAGLTGSSGSADGTGTVARFNTPYSVTVDNSGNLYVGDLANHLIRKITPAGVVSTLAGSAGNAGNVDGTGSAARFKFPGGVGIDRNGNLYVAGNYNHSIRKISPAGEVTTVAGTLGGADSADGIGSQARFNNPGSLAFDGSGHLYVADTLNNVIRKVSPGGVVTTLAGTAGGTGSADGIGSAAQFNLPGSVAADSSGTVYVADTYNSTIRKITAAGVVSTLAGSVTNAGSADGTGSEARFNFPGSLAVDRNGTIYVADTYNSTIRKITAAGVVSTLAGSVTNTGSTDGTGSEARFYAPFGVAVDLSGNVYVADTYNHTIRKVTPAGVVTTLAGSAGNPGSTDGTGTAAQFTYPTGLAVDGSGNVYVGDTYNFTIRKITPAGVVTTLAGAPGIADYAEGSGSEARFSLPAGLVVDSAGFLYVADAGNNIIRKGNAALPDLAVADLTIGPPGVLRHLSVSNLTTTSWTWDFLRYPAASAARLSSTTASNPTFTPDVPDMYVVRFQGRDNQGRVAIKTLQIGVDGRAPTLSFTSPKSGLRWSNAVFTVTGKTSDDVGVTSVWCQLNGGSWVKANGTASWSVSLNLSAGTNIVRAYALDGAGHASTTNSLSFVHVPSALVTVQISGNGTLFPNYNGKLLEVGKTYKMTAVPALGFAFRGWSGDVTTNAAALVFVLRTNLALTATFADAVNPTLAITAPKANQRWSNAVFTVTGTAKDNARIAGVWCQLNNNNWLQASGTTNWSTVLTLTPGTNTIRAYAQDTAGRVSLTNSVKWVYVLSDRLKLLTAGQGAVTPNYGNALLELGRNYTLTAKPAIGSVFSNWMDTAGTVLAETPALTFTMRSNLGLQATFIPNPFKSAQGNYAGLFYDTNAVGVTNSGLFTATLGEQGSFSSKVQITGTNYGLAGRFSLGGGFAGTIVRRGSSPLQVQLHLDLQGGELITGQVSDGVWTAELAANRAVYSKTNPAPLGGKKFTLVIPGGQEEAGQPGGFGFGRVTVSSTGGVLFSGRLSDGTAVSQATFLSKQGQWPLYQSLYAGKGHLMGWLTINTNDPESDLSGLLSWIKLPQPLAKLFRAGFEFSNGIEAVGSLFNVTKGVPALNWTRGTLLLDGGNLTQGLTNSVQIAPNLKVSSTNKVSLTITNSSGWFQGRVVDPVTGKPIVLNGTLLQKQNTGYGYFLGTNSSGRVYLGPQ